MTPEEEKQLFDTLNNLMEFQTRLETGLRSATNALIQLHNRVVDLEKMQKRSKAAPAILDVHGERAN